MPHGAGHAGGHHGGHYGGGYHHHHHHGGYGYRAYGYGGGPYYRYGYRRRSLGWGFFWLVIFAVAVTLAVVFSVRYGVPNDNSSSNDFAPNETRAVTFSYVFCDSIDLTTILTGISDPTTATFYMLSKLPQLNDFDSFNFTESPSFSHSTDYHYWNFHLYPGSSLSVSACKKDSLAYFDYYLIRGKNNFKKWVGDIWSSAVLNRSPISKLCSSDSKQQIDPYNVNIEGEYYMVFYDSIPSGSGFDSLEIDFDITRTKYSVSDPNTILSNCSLSDTSQDCSLVVPLHPAVGLVSLDTTGTTEEINWSAGISVDAYCHARIWVYAVISIGCVVVFVLFVSGLVGCCCYCRHRNRKNYAPLSAENQTTTAVTTTVTPPAPATTTIVTGNINGAHPPYNPSYGSTGPAPPKYY